MILKGGPSIVSSLKIKPTTKRVVAVLGGSFDPPTISHMQAASEVINMFVTNKLQPKAADTSPAEQAETELKIDEIWIVPCGLRPDKPHISKPEIRLAMTKLAINDFFPADTPVKIDPIEVENGPSIPTAYLLDQYQQNHPDFEFLFVGGTDLISSLHWWEDGQKLIDESKFLIFDRRGYSYKELLQHQNWPKNCCLVGTENNESLLGAVSATEVRRRVKNGMGIVGLVSNSVLEYINKNNLYV